MAILDKMAEFADATALSTAATGTANVGNVIDLGSGDPLVGDIDGLTLVIEIDTAVTSAGAATVAFQLVSDSTATPATDGSQTILATTESFPKASLVAGFRAAAIRLPKGFAYERYLGIQQDVGTAALTAGKINAYLTPDAPMWAAAQAGI